MVTHHRPNLVYTARGKELDVVSKCVRDAHRTGVQTSQWKAQCVTCDQFKLFHDSHFIMQSPRPRTSFQAQNHVRWVVQHSHRNVLGVTDIHMTRSLVGYSNVRASQDRNAAALASISQKCTHRIQLTHFRITIAIANKLLATHGFYDSGPGSIPLIPACQYGRCRILNCNVIFNINEPVYAYLSY